MISSVVAGVSIAGLLFFGLVVYCKAMIGKLIPLDEEFTDPEE